MSKTLYVKTSSYDFWWGVHGLSPLTGWEDIALYKDEKQRKKLISLCVCARNYIENAVEELRDDPDEADFVEKMQAFLDGDTVRYHFYYDRPGDEDLYELPYAKMPRNEQGLYPRSLEIWHPSRGIDKTVIESCIREVSRDYLDQAPELITFIKPVDREKAIQVYVEDSNRFDGTAKMVFTEELIGSMMKQMSLTRDEVMKILQRSV